MDHHSFRAQLVFSIGFALSRSQELLRWLLREHALDDARRELAERVVKELEGSGFELDEMPGCSGNAHRESFILRRIERRLRALA